MTAAPSRFLRRSTRPIRLLPRALGLALLASSPAFALQPLGDFVQSAEATHPDARAASAVEQQRQAEAAGSTWRLLPTFTAMGSYTRNQYQIDVTFPGRSGPEPIIARDQFDASLKLSVPIVNVAAWESKAATSAQLDLAQAQSEVVRQDLSRRVTRAYYQLLGTSAVRQAAVRSLGLATESAAVVKTRRDNGAATQLEVERADADVARAEQDVTAATLAETLAARDLHTLSGMQPSPVSAFPSDDLHEEAPLAEWSARALSAPQMDAARAAERSAEKHANAAQAWLYPVVTGSAEERFTNATALFGAEAFYAFKVSLSWTLDGASYHQAKAARAQIAGAEAREVGSRQQVEDAIFTSWHQVQAGLERARAARRQEEASARAAQLAQAQYTEGMATQLDVLTARQNAFAAEVARIQVDADLGYSRTLLRILAAGDPAARGPNDTTRAPSSAPPASP